MSNNIWVIIWVYIYTPQPDIRPMLSALCEDANTVFAFVPCFVRFGFCLYKAHSNFVYLWFSCRCNIAFRLMSLPPLIPASLVVGTEIPEWVTSRMNVCCQHGHGCVKDPGASEKRAKPSPLRWGSEGNGMVVCLRRLSAVAFSPWTFMAWRLLPYRACPCCNLLNLCLDPAVHHDPSSLSIHL